MADIWFGPMMHLLSWKNLGWARNFPEKAYEMHFLELAGLSECLGVHALGLSSDCSVGVCCLFFIPLFICFGLVFLHLSWSNYRHCRLGSGGEDGARGNSKQSPSGKNRPWLPRWVLAISLSWAPAIQLPEKVLSRILRRPRLVGAKYFNYFILRTPTKKVALGHIG